MRQEAGTRLQKGFELRRVKSDAMRAAACFALIVLLTAHAGTNEINITTENSVNVMCGENVTLRCHIDDNVSVVHYYWTDESNHLCNHASTTTDRIYCTYTDTQKKLTLNIRQATPTDNGTYICMAHTSSGHGMSKTHLHVSDCSHQAEASVNRQTRNHACASGSGWISALVSLITILTLVSDLGI